MSTLSSRLCLLTSLALASVPPTAGAQPAGSEFQVNTYATSDQRTAGDRLVAADASGNFVVVWSGSGQGDVTGIFGQRYDREGGAQGSEFRVNSYTTSDQELPSVAAAASGNFVVVWESYGQDCCGRGIFAQRFDGAGGALGAEFRVNSSVLDDQASPSVASDASGDFVVTWSSGYDGYEEILGQRYDSAGVAQGDEFRVSSPPEGDHDEAPSIAADASGDFVVVWSRYFLNYNQGVFGQRYDSGGVAQGGEFRVDASSDRSPGSSPSVASDASRNFVVVWDSLESQYSGNTDIFGQRYDSEGVARGDPFQANTHTTGFQLNPSVASDAGGNFVVAWSGPGQGDASGVFGRRYDSEGVAQGPAFRVNSFTTGAQEWPSLAATGTNQFVAAWESNGQDGSGDGVFGQRFNFAADTITVVSPNTNVKWRIGSLHRIQWTHDLGQDATFRIELDRDDDGEYEELIAAAAPVDNATRGHFAWTVTGPPSGTARVRVSWTDDLGVSDASDATFQIRPSGAS